MQGIGTASTLRSFFALPGIPGDPYFSLEANAKKYCLPEAGSEAAPDFASLKEMIVDPTSIEELQCFLPLIRDTSGRVGFTPEIREFGVYYGSDTYPVLEAHGISWLLVLRPGDKPGEPGLKELFAHELAHHYAGEEHGVVFAIALNAIRSRCGMSPTTDLYDLQNAFDEFDFEFEPAEAAAVASSWCAEIGFALAASGDLSSTLQGQIETIRSRLWSARSEIQTIEDLSRIGDQLMSDLAHR